MVVWLRRHQVGLALMAIFLVAALLRLPYLTRHDVVDDEALMAFRSIGWLDTWFGSMRTPLDVFDSEQWWQKLSFHDHPPLTFLIEHWSFRAFGPTVVALRLPFALAGMISIWLVYLLGRDLHNQRFGVLAAGVMAVSNYSVWLSRVGFQEGILLVWILAALWLFLKSFNNQRWCIGVGIAVGLALLTKYSAVVLIPVILIGYAWLRPRYFRSAYAGAGVLLMLLLLSPVIVYNVMLFRTRGHLDATLWAMLGQRHADFASDYHPYSTLGNALKWWHWLPDGFGWLVFGVAVAGAALFLYRVFRHRQFSRASSSRAASWIVLSYTVSAFLFVALSPGRRQYVAVLIVPVALATAYALFMVLRRQFGIMAVAAVLALVAVQTANSQLAMQPFGREGVTYLPLRPIWYVHRNLEAYLDAAFKGQPPAVQTTIGKQFTAYLRARLKAQFGSENPTFPGRPLLVIWDERMDFSAVRWTMFVRAVYLWQPTNIATKLVESAHLFRADYFDQSGFTDYRFIFVEPELLQRYGLPNEEPTISRRMREMLEAADVALETIIFGQDGTRAFAVYRIERVTPLLEMLLPKTTIIKEGE